jgi:hypothetical protein
LLGCEVAFTAAKAVRMQELIEDATGEPCPCKRGRECPILPSGLDLEGGACPSPQGALAERDFWRAVPFRYSV